MPSLFHRGALFCGLLLLGATLATHGAAQTPAAPAATPPLGAPPAAEDAFIKAIDEARQPFLTGLNEMVRGVARPRRAEALCRIVPRGRVENWTGKLVALTSSPGGRGVVTIELAPKVTVGMLCLSIQLASSPPFATRRFGVRPMAVTAAAAIFTTGAVSFRRNG